MEILSQKSDLSAKIALVIDEHVTEELKNNPKVREANERIDKLSSVNERIAVLEAEIVALEEKKTTSEVKTKEQEDELTQLIAKIDAHRLLIADLEQKKTLLFSSVVETKEGLAEVENKLAVAKSSLQNSEETKALVDKQLLEANESLVKTNDAIAQKERLLIELDQKSADKEKVHGEKLKAIENEIVKRTDELTNLSVQAISVGETKGFYEKEAEKFRNEKEALVAEIAKLTNDRVTLQSTIENETKLLESEKTLLLSEKEGVSRAQKRVVEKEEVIQAIKKELADVIYAIKDIVPADRLKLLEKLNAATNKL